MEIFSFSIWKKIKIKKRTTWSNWINSNQSKVLWKHQYLRVDASFCFSKNKKLARRNRRLFIRFVLATKGVHIVQDHASFEELALKPNKRVRVSLGGHVWLGLSFFRNLGRRCVSLFHTLALFPTEASKGQADLEGFATLSMN